MRWSEIYNKCNNKKYSKITNIKEEKELSSNLSNFIKENGKTLIIISFVILILLLVSFKTNISILVYCLVFFIILIILMLYYNTYKIVLGKNNLKIEVALQKYVINVDSLANIYLEKEKMHLCGIPIYTYSLNIIYIEDTKAMIYSFSTIMLSKKKTIDFFNNIETEELEQQKQFEKENKQQKIERIQAIKAIIITVVIVIIVFAIILGIVSCFK